MASFTGTSGNDTLIGTTGGDVLDAREGDDSLLGGFGNDVLYGGTGNDLLDGGAGSDVMYGGDGDDTYIVDATSDSVYEYSGQGEDTVMSSVAYTLTDSVERLTLTGTANINGTGNWQNNVITGNSGANTLDGGSGTDTLRGGLGNDVYIVDSAADLVEEAAAGGTDEVRAYVDWVLGAELERLTLLGSATFATGNSSNNVITGNNYNNTLDGGAGNDTLIGAAGDDVYLLDSLNDVVSEIAGYGNDTVRTSVGGLLANNVENVYLLGSANLGATGNTLNNVIVGNDGNNALSGGTGADYLQGGRGNDTYFIDNGSDTVYERADEGVDTISSAITYGLPSQVENLTLSGSGAISAYGNELPNLLVGNGGVNVLDGGAGNDTLRGGGGNDEYVVDTAGDVIEELSGGGTDLVRSPIDWALGANLENLTLTGYAAINGTGNSLNNVLTGNDAPKLLEGGSGNDTLSGAGGWDTLIGGLGNDVYLTDGADTLIELAGGGTDTVTTYGSFDLAATPNVENLKLLGDSATNAYGNTGNNVLTGNNAANWLSGGAGSDTLQGGLGDDTYVIDDSLDTVIEATDAGRDTVRASVNYTLGANLENLVLTGSASLTATGNELANSLAGNDAANRLDGGAGADYLYGQGGNDSLVYDAADSWVDGGVGEDTVVLNGSGATLDLSGSTRNLSSIERVDLSNQGNTVSFAWWTVTALSDSDLMTIDGGASDHVAAYGRWFYQGDINGYARYTQSGATLDVATAIDRSAITLNQAPIVTVPGSQSLNEDTGRYFASWAGSPITVSDPEGDPISLTLSVSTGSLYFASTWGLWNWSGNGTGTVTLYSTEYYLNNALNGLWYVSQENYNGSVRFDITAADAQFSTTNTLELTVNPVNDAPVATDTSTATDEDTPVSGQLPDGQDVDGDAVSYALWYGSGRGAVTVNPDGSFVYSPYENLYGQDSFGYYLNDGYGGYAYYTVQVMVNGVNDAPTAADTSVTLDEDQESYGWLPTGRDADGDGLTYGLAQEPANGSAVVNPDGSFRYLPNPDFVGTDSFQYTLSDGNGGSSIYLVQLNINAVNDAPVGVTPHLPQTKTPPLRALCLPPSMRMATT
ncbi:MAG: tandem-95 repeat protein [Gammaproteobacteria bacterium]|nr:tandem-95 repeat protein [Gammaproteobacteria bacterium]